MQLIATPPRCSSLYRKILNFLSRTTRLVVNELPLFVMLMIYSTIPTYFDGPYIYKTYLMLVVPQCILPTLILCLLASWKRLMWWLVFITANMMFTLELGCYFSQHCRLNSCIAILIMQSNLSESVEFLESTLPQVLKAVATGLAIAVAILVWNYIWKRKFLYTCNLRSMVNGMIGRSIGVMLIAISVYGGLVGFKVARYHADYWTRMWDMSDASTYITYYYDFKDSFFNPEMQNLDILKRSIAEADVKCIEVPERLTIVYVVGESFSRARSSLFGYPMCVNPNLAREFEAGRLIVFDNVITHSPRTLDVYRAMLSTWDILGKEKFTDFALLPALMKKGGYHVSYFDNQSLINSGKGFDFGCTYFFSDKEIRDLSVDSYNDEIKRYDGELVECFPPCSHSALQFTIYHLMGQHVMFKSRYPEDFSYFKPEMYPPGMYTRKQAEIVAQYDNATLYNDYVLGQIINQLRDKPSVLIYAPDHGEQVYDYRDEMGRNIKASLDNVRIFYEVPAFVWVSDKYKLLFPEKIEAMNRNIHKAIYNSDLPHTVLDIAGIKTRRLSGGFSLVEDGPGRPIRMIGDINYDAMRDTIATFRMRYELPK